MKKDKLYFAGKEYNNNQDIINLIKNTSVADLDVHDMLNYFTGLDQTKRSLLFQIMSVDLTIDINDMQPNTTSYVFTRVNISDFSEEDQELASEAVKNSKDMEEFINLLRTKDLFKGFNTSMLEKVVTNATSSVRYLTTNKLRKLTGDYSIINLSYILLYDMPLVNYIYEQNYEKLSFISTYGSEDITSEKNEEIDEIHDVFSSIALVIESLNCMVMYDERSDIVADGLEFQHTIYIPDLDYEEDSIEN